MKGRIALTRFLLEAENLDSVRPRDVARAWRRLGRIQQAQGDYEDATLSYDKSQALLESLGDFRSVAFLHTSQADLAMARGRLSLAQREADKARKKREKADRRMQKRVDGPGEVEIISAEEHLESLPTTEEALRTMEWIYRLYTAASEGRIVSVNEKPT